jgi:hypothetical protein
MRAMSQIDHLLGPHEDPSPARIGLADASRFDTPAHPDSSKSDERATAGGTLTIPQAVVLLGVGLVETIAVQDSGMKQADHLLTRQKLAEYLAPQEIRTEAEAFRESGRLCNDAEAVAVKRSEGAISDARPLEHAAEDDSQFGVKNPSSGTDTSEATAWDPSGDRGRTKALADGVHILVWQSRAQQGLPQFIEDKGTLARVASLISVRNGQNGFPPDLQERRTSAKALTPKMGASRSPSLAVVRSNKSA